MCEMWKKEKLKWITWGILTLFLFIYYISMYYWDIDQTNEGSLILLDCLFEGKLFEFYRVYSGLYFITVFAIFAIWNFPIWVISRFYGGAITDLGCRLWSKGLVVLFAVGCIWMLYCILKKLEYNEKEWTIFLFVSSLLFACPVFAVAQYDVIEIFFMLCGIYYYIKDEKLSWRSILFFSIAISAKLFAVFVFFIFVLATEKKFLKIIYKMILGFSFAGVTMFPFWINNFWDVSGELNSSIAERFFGALWPGGSYGISLFFLGYFTICLIAYLSEEKNIRKRFSLLNWLTTAFFLILFTFVYCYPYWYILIMPFLSILVTEYKENLKINMLLEILLEGAIMLALGYSFTWVLFGEGSFSTLIFQNRGVNGKIANIADIVNALGLSSYIHGVFTIFFFCGMAILVMNNPWKPVLVREEEKELIIAEKVTRIMRVGMIGMYFVATWIIAFCI